MTSSKLVFENIKTDFGYKNAIEKRKRLVNFYYHSKKVNETAFLMTLKEAVKTYFPQNKRCQLLDNPLPAKIYLHKYSH